jgi:Flp pilus assembly protein TadD
MMQARQWQLSQAYLQLVLRLEPRRDEAWVMLGDVLAQSDDEGGARAAYGKLGPGDPDYLAARSKLAWSYQRAGDAKRAVEIAREAERLAPGRGGDLVLAELLRADGQYAEALQLMTGALQRRPDDWRIRFARATVLEQMDRWPEAEADLKMALL